MRYLDPRGLRVGTDLEVPAVRDLAGRTLGFLNNGWTSFGKIGKRIERALKTDYGISLVNFYDIPRSTAPTPGLLERIAAECELVIAGMAN